MAKKNLDSTKPPTSIQAIDWGEVFKHQVPTTLDDLERVLSPANKMISDDLSRVFRKLECHYSAKVASFLVELADLPEIPTILFARNDIGILAYCIRQLRPQARFTFYSDDIDVNAYHSYLFPYERAPSPKALLELAAEEKEQFDLVIGIIRREDLVIHTFGDAGLLYPIGQPRGYDDRTLLIALAKLLKDGGRLFSDVWESHRNGYMKDREAERHWLQEFCKLTGLSVNAVIEDVPGSDLGFGNDGVVVINSKAPQGKVFSAQYSDDERIRDTIVSSFLTQLPAKRVHAGYWSSLDSYESNSRLRHVEQVRTLASRARLAPVKLGEILGSSGEVEDSSGDEGNVFSVKAVEINSGNDMPRALVSHGKHPGWSIHVYIDRDKALAEYIVGFLNESELGNMILPDLIAEVDEQSNQPMLSDESVRNFTVYLPDLKTQVEVVRNGNILASLRSDIDENLLQLWREPEKFDEVRRKIKMINTEDTLPDWIDQLPFPLASILWNYHAECGIDKARYETLLHFFEACAAFLCTIHLSALASTDSLWREIKPRIRKQEKHVHMRQATFGTWNTLFEILAKFTRDGVGNNALRPEILNAYKVSQSAPIQQLSSASIITILKPVMAVRNNWGGHGGAIDDKKAREIHDKLAYFLRELRELITGIWEHYDLVLAGPGKYFGGEYRYEAQRIMGSRAGFEKCEIGTVQPLKYDRLHLVSRETSKAIELLPFLRVVPSPITNVNACYFYSKMEAAGRARFVSYHFGQDSELHPESSPEFADALRLFED